VAELTIEHIARIEGHGNIAVKVEGGHVLEVRMDVVEPARFFEAMVVGRRYDEAPLITSRICGICSPNHALTSIKAIEAALGVEVSDRTTVLRKLLVYGSFLQNHATHLYVLAAPDFVGLDSVFPLAATHPDVVERALKIKSLGNRLTALVGGRPVHPVTAVVGGFSAEPNAADLASFRDQLLEVAADVLATVDLFASFALPDFASSGDMLALVESGDYAIYGGDIESLDRGWRRPVSEYRDVIVESPAGEGHGNAKHSRTTADGKTFMVGSLPRVNLSGDRLTPGAKTALAKLGLRMPSRNPFHMNLCQAVELVDAAERCAGYIELLLEMGGSSKPAAVQLREGWGAGATEAPRGTLYHSYGIDASGVITSGDVITPTAQNLANLEADMRAFAPSVADSAPKEFELAIEQLVRSYDPCLSCSVH
jgi:coenzyme F420-reducing hydrogenase alpha subunit